MAFVNGFKDQSTPATAFEGAIGLQCLRNVDTLNMCGSHKSITNRMTAIRTWTYFASCITLHVNRGYACAMIVHTNADQLLSQLLMDQFDTLSTQ